MSNNKWITGPEILKRWNQPELELLNAHMDGGLRAYTRRTMSRIRYFRYNGMIMTAGAGGRILPPYFAVTRDDVSRILIDPELIIFSFDEVEEYEQQHGTGPEPKSAEKMADNAKPLKTASIPDGAEWRDIQIRVVAVTRIEVEAGRVPELFSYEELQLDTQSQLAKLLEGLAKKERITTDEKQNISLLRKKIKELFPNISGDPLPCKDGVYTTAFFISFMEAV